MSQSPHKKKCCISHKYFSHCVRLSDFPLYSKDTKFTEDVRLTNLLFITSKLYENLKIAQRYTVESKCPTESYGQRNPQFNWNLAAVSIFWNIDKAFDTTWHSGLLQKLSKLQFSFGAVRRICYSCQKENSLCRWKETVHANSPRVDFLPQHSILIPLLCCLYPKHISQTPALFADDTCMHAT